jgi:hypothetical protein
MIAPTLFIAVAAILLSASLLGLRALRRSAKAQRKFLRIVCGYMIGTPPGAFAVVVPELAIRGRSDTGAAVGAFAGAMLGIVAGATIRTRHVSTAQGVVGDANATLAPVSQGHAAGFWTATVGAVVLLALAFVIPANILPQILCTILIDALLLVGCGLLVCVAFTMFRGPTGRVPDSLLAVFVTKLWLMAAILIVAFFVSIVACVVAPFLDR